MTTDAERHDFYSQPGTMTSAGAYGGWFEGLPADPPSIAKVLQGLVVHEHMTGMYNVSPTDEQKAEVHTRRVERVLDCMHSRSDQPLGVVRPPSQRFVGDCRHFSVLMVTILRSKGIPARARCGFGAYFEEGKFIDHWVCEYWNQAEDRWILVDAQIDNIQRKAFDIDFDLMDVPHNRFLIAGLAWKRYRSGRVDPALFGIMNLNGPAFMAGNVLRDFAALNNMEMLPWDVWGAMATLDESISEEKLALYDRVAALTLDPDENFDEMRDLYETNEQLRVPTVVLNAVMQREDRV